jgi:Domain of unknown function (DUF4184)
MPYTIAHAAAVLPFSRLFARWKMLSAVVIGSMVPDFRVFIPWQLARFETHSLQALITFVLPVGLLTYWIFQRFVKAAVVEVLPEGPYARWHPFARSASLRSVRQWLSAALGILIGAMTHLVWDAFTHDGSRGVRLFPALEDPLFDIGRRHVVGVRLMQDLGSLLGLFVVLAFAAYSLRRGREPPLPNRLVSPAERINWMSAYAVGAVIAIAAFYFSDLEPIEPNIHSLGMHVYDIAVSALRGLAAALLIVSLALGARLRMLRYRSSGPDR